MQFLTVKCLCLSYIPDHLMRPVLVSNCCREQGCNREFRFEHNDILAMALIQLN